jgi:hypothetical protein
MKNYALFTSLFLLAGCFYDRSKKDHKFTVNYCEYMSNKCTCNLYGEVYNIYGMGALGSDVNALYLTDSTNFRIYLGTYDEGNEMIIVKCQGDSICIKKTAKSVFENSRPEIIQAKIYSLKFLKVKHQFE